MTQRQDWKNNGWFHIALLVCTVAIAYSKLLHAGFMSWDDPAYVINNADIRGFSWAHISNWFSSFYVGNYQPLTIFSYAIDYLIGGQSPLVYHITNVLLHMANAILLYTILYRLFDKKTVALFVALFFALHPVQTESVSWIAERKNVLYAFFFLLSVSYYISYVTEEYHKKYWGVVLMGIAAMLSKVAAVTLPFALFAVDVWLQRPLKGRKLMLEKIPLIAVAIIIGAVNIKAQAHGEFLNLHPELNVLQSLVYAGYAYTAYIVGLAYSFEQSVLYPYPQGISAIHIIYSIITLAILYAGWWSYKKKYYVLCGSIIWYTVNIAIVLQFVQFGEVLMADRYVYIPCIAVWLSLVYYSYDAYSKREKNSIGMVVIFFMAALIMLLATYLRNDIWLSEMKFWKSVVATFPNSSTAQASLGGVYLNEGKYDEAQQHIDAAIEADPDNYKAWYNKGVIHLRKGEAQAALQSLDKAIALHEYPKALFTRALLFMQTGNTQRALNDIEKVLVQEPENARAFYIKGNCLELQNSLQAAADNYTQAILYEGEEPLFYLRRGVVNVRMGANAAALSDLSSAIAIKNDYAEAWYWRGIVKKNMGREPCNDLNEARKLGYGEAVNALRQLCNAD